MIQDIIEIADHFGEETQKKKLLEELMELAVADSKKANKYFIDEASDVIILIMERAYQRGITEEQIEERMCFKLDRTKERIKEGYYENNT